MLDAGINHFCLPIALNNSEILGKKTLIIPLRKTSWNRYTHFRPGAHLSGQGHASGKRHTYQDKGSSFGTEAPLSRQGHPSQDKDTPFRPGAHLSGHGHTSEAKETRLRTPYLF